MKIFRVRIPLDRIVEVEAASTEELETTIKTKYGYKMGQCLIVSIYKKEGK